MAAIRARQTPVQSYYYDLDILAQTWNGSGVYHHTVPISFLYAILEALRIVEEEGLDARGKRHELHRDALVAGLEALNLEMLVAPAYRLATVTTVRIPEPVTDEHVRGRLLYDWGIELGGGLGPLKGNIWRIGVMGSNASANTVTILLGALRRALEAEGHRCGDGVGAAKAIYEKHAAE